MHHKNKLSYEFSIIEKKKFWILALILLDIPVLIFFISPLFVVYSSCLAFYHQISFRFRSINFVKKTTF